ncbi:MAG: vancomycin resistance histidine kinase VanS [Anaerocolumna aminovalerica]|nr:vancomycin resistance histidine kinase VanS [Anaerocolumna aminovalerica]MBU5332789.1 HAMP domain-containing histidine kinase [Anaerocolumna aminovalerica]MDU6266378.1 vancomycin resistance histidine kinase VanS [Anaerocolumna aminovalerica]
MFFSYFTWYSEDIIYRILKIIDYNKGLFLGFCWIIGSIVIFLIYWRKTLGYVDTIVEASNELVEPGDDFIHLPDELKQVENQMNQIKQQAIRNARLAKESEQRKNDLIVYLAHDLKTPLTSVIGYLTLLRDELQISEEQREKYLSISLDKAERLEELINEFFEITRFNLSNLSLEVSRTNLSRMLEQIVYEFKPLFNTKNLECKLDIAPNMEIKCDINKMERVFDNLIRNAINYSFENSTIEITVSKEQDYISMSFLNHGNTISEEKLSRIFEQFYRLDTSRGTKTGGAGLGLAIAKEIIELHQGTITASSENECIQFVVRLPNSN